MKMLVTGGCGYIGGPLTARLLADGHAVRVLHRSSRVPQAAESVTGDIRDRAIWETALVDIDAVVHLAAQTSTYVADGDPVSDAAINVQPVLDLLDAIRRSGRPRAVVLASTATVFGLPQHLPVDDAAPVSPVTTYDLHKRMAEQYLELYAGRGFVTGAALRLCNVYGPGPQSSSAEPSA
jgi:UDP-glucose 4-epimerase